MSADGTQINPVEEGRVSTAVLATAKPIHHVDEVSVLGRRKVYRFGGSPFREQLEGISETVAAWGFLNYYRVNSHATRSTRDSPVITVTPP